MSKRKYNLNNLSKIIKNELEEVSILIDRIKKREEEKRKKEIEEFLKKEREKEEMEERMWKNFLKELEKEEKIQLEKEKKEKIQLEKEKKEKIQLEKRRKEEETTKTKNIYIAPLYCGIEKYFSIRKPKGICLNEDRYRIEVKEEKSTSNLPNMWIVEIEKPDQYNGIYESRPRWIKPQYGTGKIIADEPDYYDKVKIGGEWTYKYARFKFFERKHASRFRDYIEDNVDEFNQNVYTMHEQFCKKYSKLYED